MTPRIVVLAAPSGSGKTTIARALVASCPDVGFSVSATTRAPRPGEQDGEAYHFVTREEFARRRGAGEFLEAAEYAGNWYGTLKNEVERVRGVGRHVLLDIEIQGARQVRRTYPPPESVSIFIVPPSAAALMARLHGRKSESGPALALRLDRALEELQAAPEFDYILVNDDLDRAVAAVAAIIDGPRSVPERRDGLQDTLNTLARDLAREAGRLRREA
ncbi:MAG: guanylate kinase [Gemmatimonadetes bacterium]|nr:guanylate kinase [Gemmatimonadota bacterium]